MFNLTSKTSQPESAAHAHDMFDWCERAALSVVARLARCNFIGWRAQIEDRGLTDTVDIVADELRSAFDYADTDDLADMRRWMGETDQDAAPMTLEQMETHLEANGRVVFRAEAPEPLADVQPLTEGELIALAAHQTLTDRAQAALLGVTELAYAIPDVERLKPVFAAIMENLDQDVKNDLRKFGDVWAEIRDDKPDQDATTE